MGETFTEDHIATIGAGFAVKRIEVSENEMLELQIWDLAGQAGMEVLLQRYLLGTQSAFVVFDLTRRESFFNMDEWFRQLFLNSEDEKIPVVILGNKKDLDDYAVEESEVLDYIEKIKIKYPNISHISYILTSALTGENVDLAFDAIVKFLVTSAKANSQ
jgi:small GTP-binding protein